MSEKAEREGFGKPPHLRIKTGALRQRYWAPPIPVIHCERSAWSGAG